MYELKSTNEKLTTTDLEEIKALAEKYLEKAEDCDNVAQKSLVEEDLDTIIDYYKAVSKAECFAECKKAENPMHHAVLTYFYPTIKVKESKVEGSDVKVRSIEPAQRTIDLRELHKKCDGIGYDTKWIYRAEKFNYYLTIKAKQDVGDKVKFNPDNFVMNNIAREMDMGKNPCSNTQMLKSLQSIITMMLGEGYKVTSHDVQYLVRCYTRDNKNSTTSVIAANHRGLISLLKKICYRILTDGKGYTVEQREIKEGK